jgi:hypothetical protein
VIQCLLQSPSGLCRRAELSVDQITGYLGTTTLRGWGNLDGDAIRLRTTSRSEALVPLARIPLERVDR